MKLSVNAIDIGFKSSDCPAREQRTKKTDTIKYWGLFIIFIKTNNELFRHRRGRLDQQSSLSRFDHGQTLSAN